MWGHRVAGGLLIGWAVAACGLWDAESDGGDPGADAAIDDFDCGTCDCFSQISTGGRLSCALQTDGTVWCWGHAPVGDGTGEDRLEPVQVAGLTDVAQISVGRSHACAVRADGGVWCWGDNAQSQLGDGTTVERREPVAVTEVGSAVAVLATGRYTCAHLAGGTVECWGTSYIGTANQVQADQIAISDNHLCERKPDRSVWCIGSNENGELGTGATQGAHIIPVQSQLDDAIDLSADLFRTVVARADGSVWWTGWGLDGTHPDPVQVEGVADAIDVDSGQQHDCARREDGTLWCWGLNVEGQLGDGTTESSVSAVQVSGLSNVELHSAGGSVSCALVPGEPLQCWGANYEGTLGNGTIGTHQTRPTPVHLACD